MKGASLDDQVRMAEEADRIVKDTAGLSEEQILEKLEQNIIDQTIAKKIEGRNRALNSFAKRNVEQFVRTFEGDPALGFEAALVGINDVKMGSRRSVAGMQEQLQGQYMAGMVSDIEGLGRPQWDAFISGKYDDDIARAMWQIDNGDDFSAISSDAVDIAKQIHKWQEVSRTDANKAGAWIKKLPGYIVRQSHDMDSIRNAGFDEWRRTIEPVLDERTFADIEDRDAFLQSAFDGLATGIHLGTGTVPGLKGARNIAKAASQERVLHFKEADGWLQYNARFGRGSLREGVMSGLMMSAQNTGLMKVLGPNAQANLETVLETFTRELKKTDPNAAVKFQSAERGRLDNFFKMVSGETNIPGSAMGAQVGQFLRAFQSITKLGGAVISSIADIPVSASELRYQGKNFFQAYGGALKNAGGAVGDMGKSIAGRRLTVGNQARRRVLAELGVALDATTGLFTSRFDIAGEAVPGKVSNAMNTFFRLNGLTLWTDSMRAGSTIGMAQHIGGLSKNGWDDIPAGLQDTLTLFGISRGEWDLIRSVGAREFEGVDGEFITPEMLDDLGDDVLVAHLESIEVKPTKFQVSKLRSDLKDSLRTYYVDRSQFAVIEPDAKTRAVMLRDSQPGTVAGEVMRNIAQFKSFPFAIVQKVWGREIRGRETKRAAAMGMAEFLVATTFFGYIAMSAKDIAKNRTPRNPEEPKTWVAAFLQGGAAGIYGDFLFGDVKNRFGGGFVSTLAGPTAGTIDQVATIYGKARDGEDAGKDLFRLAYQGVPAAAGVVYPPAVILNSVYVKATLDHLIYYNVMEALSPGYKRRMERRLRKENDQEILIK